MRLTHSADASDATLLIGSNDRGYLQIPDEDFLHASLNTSFPGSRLAKPLFVVYPIDCSRGRAITHSRVPMGAHGQHLRQEAWMAGT